MLLYLVVIQYIIDNNNFFNKYLPLFLYRTQVKKLTDDIWEFRTLYNKKQYRLFAFWDKTTNTKTLVIATHGIVKKSKKTPTKEILRAKELMKQYFEK